MQKEQRNSSVFSVSNAIKLAAVAVGGYALWRNRFKIQRMLEARGIETPWLNDSVAEAVQSGAAKLTGSIENTISSASTAAKKAGTEVSRATH